MWVGDSVVYCVNRDDSFGFDISDGFIYGIDDELEMLYSGELFDDLNDGKHWVAFRNEPLE